MWWSFTCLGRCVYSLYNLVSVMSFGVSPPLRSSLSSVHRSQKPRLLDFILIPLNRETLIARHRCISASLNLSGLNPNAKCSLIVARLWEQQLGHLHRRSICTILLLLIAIVAHIFVKPTTSHSYWIYSSLKFPSKFYGSLLCGNPRKPTSLMMIYCNTTPDT